MGSWSWSWQGRGRSEQSVGRSGDRQTRLQAWMDCTTAIPGSLVRPSTRLMLAVILFIDYPGPVCGLWCGVVSNCIDGPGVCVYLGEPKDFVEGGGESQQGGSRIAWAVLGTLHFC